MRGTQDPVGGNLEVHRQHGSGSIRTASQGGHIALAGRLQGRVIGCAQTDVSALRRNCGIINKAVHLTAQIVHHDQTTYCTCIRISQITDVGEKFLRFGSPAGDLLPYAGIVVVLRTQIECLTRSPHITVDTASIPVTGIILAQPDPVTREQNFLPRCGGIFIVLRIQFRSDLLESIKGIGRDRTLYNLAVRLDLRTILRRKTDRTARIHLGAAIFSIDVHLRQAVHLVACQDSSGAQALCGVLCVKHQIYCRIDDALIPHRRVDGGMGIRRQTQVPRRINGGIQNKRFHFGWLFPIKRRRNQGVPKQGVHRIEQKILGFPADRVKSDHKCFCIPGFRDTG